MKAATQPPGPRRYRPVARIGILSLSDGRDFVHGDVADFIPRASDPLCAALRDAGHEVIAAPEIVWTNELATSQARWLADQRPDLTLFHYAVWAFPHFTMLAAESTRGPLQLLANIDPQYPGMVGMLAGGGALDQIGRTHSRAWGDIRDAAVLGRVSAAGRAGAAVQRLRGSTFGRIGGRPMGMYTAVGNTDQWMRTFGVDVEEIDQWEIVRRSDLVE